MNRKTLLLGSIAAIAAALGTASCNRGSQAASSSSEQAAAPQATTEAPAVTVAEPVAEPAATAQDMDLLLARAAERWDHISHADWIQAYDFFTPERKLAEKLSRFLEGKENHDYRDPSKPRLVGTVDKETFVAIEVVWTPMHPEILGADNVPPEGMTEVLALVESWSWQDGQWYWNEVTRASDFYRDHPEFAPGAEAAGAPGAGDAATPPAPGDDH